MKEAAEIPNVVNCCNREGLYEKLENLQERCVANDVLNQSEVRSCSKDSLTRGMGGKIPLRQVTVDSV